MKQHRGRHHRCLRGADSHRSALPPVSDEVGPFTFREVALAIGDDRPSAATSNTAIPPLTSTQRWLTCAACRCVGKGGRGVEVITSPDPVLMPPSRGATSVDGTDARSEEVSSGDGESGSGGRVRAVLRSNRLGLAITEGEQLPADDDAEKNGCEAERVFQIHEPVPELSW